MYNKLVVRYEDGEKQTFETEPMGRMLAKQLMNTLFYDSEVVSTVFYQEGKGRPLERWKNAL